MSDIEQEFFRTFGIEKIKYCKNFKYIKSKCDRPNSETKCIDCIGTNEEYPEITAEILLEMICIVFNTFSSFEIAYIKYTVETLKDKILSLLILAQDDVYFQIQQLFKEGE